MIVEEVGAYQGEVEVELLENAKKTKPVSSYR
jgi:hypothetical protein